MEQSELKKMIADYMENGFLENIIDMFKHDNSLYQLVGELMTDERIRVRLGMVALMEILKKEDSDNVHLAVSGIIPLLQNKEPYIRGDAAYVLGIIRDKKVLPILKQISEKDDNKDVRNIAMEAIEDMNL